MARTSGVGGVMTGAATGAVSGAGTGSMISPGWGTVIGAGIGAISGGLQAYLQSEAARELSAEERAFLIKQDRDKRERATTALSGYGYTPYGEKYQQTAYSPYTSPLQGQTEGVLAQYLSGKLSPEQEALLGHQRAQGEASIARTSAGRGMPGGGQSALSVQLGRDIGLGAGQMAQQRQQFGLQQTLPYMQFGAQQKALPQEWALKEKQTAYGYGLADYWKQQDAEARRKELLASYS